MGVAAHNIGAAEARFGPGELRRLAAKLGLPLVSANVCDSAGRAVAEPVRIVTCGAGSAGGTRRRVALLGVLGEQFATTDLQVAPARQAVLDMLPKLAGKYDALVVLAYLPEDQLRQLADAVPEADAVIGGPTGQPISPKPAGPVLLCSATRDGKFLARLDAPGPDTGPRWSGSIVELNGQFADDPAQAANIDRYRRELAEADFTAGQNVLCPRAAGAAAGAVCRCRNGRLPKVPRGRLCVVAEVEACRGMAIAGGQRGDRRSRLPALPRDRLRLARRLRLAAAERQSARGRLRELPWSLPGPRAGARGTHGLFRRARNQCTACHDRENSPKFDYDAYWKKIAHGEKTGKGEKSEKGRTGR